MLITGLSTYWGGRLAQMLERNRQIETIIGIDRQPPKLALERTEFVQVADAHSLIRRIVEGAEIDTVVDTRLVLDPLVTSARRAHENNIVGTMNILAACGGVGSPVRKLVVRSSSRYYGIRSDDPAYFTEEMEREHLPPRGVERDIYEVERSIAAFRERNTETIVTVLRFTTALGPDVRSIWRSYLSAPVIASILGFDPRLQFMHEDDMFTCLEHAVLNDLDGTFNCGADGVLTLTEIAELLGKPVMPLLPPVATATTMAAMRRLGLPVHPDLERELRFGKAIDNRRFKATGFRFTYTTRETIIALRQHLRLASMIGQRDRHAYRYEAAVEDFLRFSPSVRRRVESDNRQLQDTDGWDGLEVGEIEALLPTLDSGDLAALREHERAHAGRTAVIDAIDRQLARQLGPA